MGKYGIISYLLFHAKNVLHKVFKTKIEFNVCHDNSLKKWYFHLFDLYQKH